MHTLLRSHTPCRLSLCGVKFTGLTMGVRALHIVPSLSWAKSKTLSLEVVARRCLILGQVPEFGDTGASTWTLLLIFEPLPSAQYCLFPPLPSSLQPLLYTCELCVRCECCVQFRALSEKGFLDFITFSQLFAIRQSLEPTRVFHISIHTNVNLVLFFNCLRKSKIVTCFSICTCGRFWSANVSSKPLDIGEYCLPPSSVDAAVRSVLCKNSGLLPPQISEFFLPHIFTCAVPPLGTVSPFSPSSHGCLFWCSLKCHLSEKPFLTSQSRNFPSHTLVTVLFSSTL